MLGLDQDRFWLITPREAEIEIKATIERKSQEAKQRQLEQKWMTWHIAALERIDQKHFPKLEAFLNLKDKKRHQKSWQEQFSKTMAWAERTKKDD